jgi:surfactin synthase thioesterase subunit
MSPLPAENPWLVCFEQRPQAHLRLFCFPYAGGGASLFRQWGALFPPEVEVYAVQLPGREDRRREEAFTEVPALIAALSQNLEPLLDRPFAFFGHSLGGLLNFELARCLRRQSGLLPLRLFIAACRAPQSLGLSFPIAGLPDAEFLAQVQLRYGDLPKAVLDEPELLQLVLKVLRSDLKALESYLYQPEPPLACAISVFGGASDPVVSREDLENWQLQTRQDLQLTILPGGHFFVNSARLIDCIRDLTEGFISSK